MPRKPKPAPQPTIIDRLKAITIWQGIGAATALASTLGPLYLTIKPIAVHAADTYVQRKLIENGLDPKAVGQALKDLEAAKKDTSQLKSDALSVQSDLATVKAQNRQLQELLEKLLEAELNN